MSNYTKLVDYAAKDLLLHGDAAKAIKGTEVGAEFDAIATMSATKIDSGGALGTPSSGTLTNCTGLPISTGISGLGTGVATFLATPSSANLASAVTGETGSGALVFATSPALVTPDIGTPSAGTLTNCTGLPQAGTVGLTTADSPQFTGVNVGHATDTTITRVSAGTIAVEGVNVLTTATGVSLTGATFTGAVNGTNFPMTQEFRLTLTTGTPVTTADVTGATTIYCTPYKGNRIALYTGTAWVTRTSAEFSLALGTLTAALPYDVFCYDNSGTPTLEFLAWTNTTTRATALAYQDGVLVKSGDATRRYLGTFYTTSTTQTEDSNAKRFLWNYYNRVSRPMRVRDATASWTYTTATFRQANNSAANQLDFLIGVSEDKIKAEVVGTASNTGAGVVIINSIGLDATTEATDMVRQALHSTGANYFIAPRAMYQGFPGVGRHYLTWLEYSAATGTTTWYGGSGAGNNGIFGEILS